ncbi:MAG TPA: shikimate dehydrogenase [Devosia sp.]|nr:shikimate dehydrogenase [Devosia sp.]
MAPIRLGIVGDNVAHSQSPSFHTLAGRHAGIDVRFDLIEPARWGLDFEAVIARCRRENYAGLNITYPYKERVLALLTDADSDVARMGSCNTVLFRGWRLSGHNTDHTGFMAAFRHGFGRPPGTALVVGAGGVGRAVVLGLGKLGASRILLADTDRLRAKAVAADLAPHLKCPIEVVSNADEAARHADGIVNCTPLGSVGHEGSPVRDESLTGKAWAFDVVYASGGTAFGQQAARAGVPFAGGYELLFHQGLDVFELFTGHTVADPKKLRAELQAMGATA